MNVKFFLNDGIDKYIIYKEYKIKNLIIFSEKKIY